MTYFTLSETCMVCFIIIESKISPLFSLLFSCIGVCFTLSCSLLFLQILQFKCQCQSSLLPWLQYCQSKHQ